MNSLLLFILKTGGLIITIHTKDMKANNQSGNTYGVEKEIGFLENLLLVNIKSCQWHFFYRVIKLQPTFYAPRLAIRRINFPAD